MEVTKAEINAVLDAQGRFVWTPNALTLDGQQNIACDLQPGESLEAFLRRHVPGIDSGAWSVSIGGAIVPRAMWAKTWPKDGMHIACRASVGKQVVMIVAMAILTYFTMGAGLALWAGTGAMATAIGAAAFVAGSILINKVLGPKVPKSSGNADKSREVHSLRNQRNSLRLYEPLPTLFGEMRITPDLASQPYTWHEGDDQYLAMRLLGGINVHTAEELLVGDSYLSLYDGVSIFYSRFSGMPESDIPLHGNVDTIAGAELPDNPNTAVVRTSSPDTVALGIDIEYTAWGQNGGKIIPAKVQLVIEYKEINDTAWTTAFSGLIEGKDQYPCRRSWQVDVPKGQYQVSVHRSPKEEGDDVATRSVTWTSLRSIQPDTTDYGGLGCIGIKIKATGQISGALDTVRATYRAKPMPIWTGAAWETATTRENGLSNPGAIILQTLRGIWHNGRLQFGYGLSDDQIDIDGIKAFMLHCAAKGYTYDRWITESISLGDFCQEVALAGMGEFSWTDGSRPTVVFVSAGQPTSAVVNMANMLKASFSVDYALSNTADGIEYQYVDREKGFETVTLRVAAPGVTTMLNPARITGTGVTAEAHAAVMARYHLAQSLYQYKTINFGADIEHLDYRRLSVLSISHDLTQWGFGGRVMGARRAGGQVQITLDQEVQPLTTPHLGLRLPGDRDYRVFPVRALTEPSDTLTLNAAWPAGVPLPGDVDAAHDTLWCYDFKATPGYKVRVTSMEPEGDLKGAKITCVPEGPEFWNYVINGVYEPAPNQSALPQLARPVVKNLRVAEEVHLQGNTEWYELHLLWDTTGDVDYCQVWAGRDGSELRLIDARAQQNRASVRIDDGGEWLLRVVPISTAGVAGTGANLLYNTQRVALAPRLPSDFVVQVIEGGLRRYSWQWASNRPANLAGVQIRYKAGNTASVSEWGAMTPLGDADDIYTAAFESSRPDAGLWTFGLRSISTSGLLSAGMLTFSINLPESLGELAEIDYTPPPAPENLQATGLFATVQVTWDAPVYPQGGGHKTTEIFAGATQDLADAQKLAEGFGGPTSFEWKLGSTVYVWARFVTQADVPGPFAGPVSAQTAEDIEQLLDVLHGQLTESQLYADLSKRIDAIDVGSPELGSSLLDAAAAQAVAHQQVQDDVNQLAIDMLQAALAADKALETVTDAGFYVDPVTGQVKLYGLEVEKGKVTNLEVLLDAMQGQLALKATTAYVDGRIAASVLSPADLILYEGLDGRIIDVATRLDSINGVLQQKASQLELTAALVRLTSAESTLDALNGQIALRVTRAEYEADQNALQARLSSAEILLNALDAPSIVATVQAASNTVKDAEKQAQALLQDILTGERNRQHADEALAFARSELTASITEGLQAEARARTLLATQFGQSMSTVEQSLSSLSAADVAEAAARLALAARLERADSVLQAGLTDESRVRADQDGALSSRITTAQATANNAVAAVQTEQSVRATETGHLGAQYTVRMQLSQGGQLVSGGFALSGTSTGTAGPTLDFGVLANRFFVAPPQGSGIASNFQLTVQTTPTTANGVTIPAGLYVDSAYITNVSALWGRFGTLVADTIRATHISASQLTLGDGTVGGHLKSRNYVTGSSGWALSPTGEAELHQVTVRGNIYASGGAIGGAVITPTEVRSSNYNPLNGAGWRLTSSGQFYAPHASVNTLTLAGDAVTVPLSASASDVFASDADWVTVISAAITLDVAGRLYVFASGVIGYPSGFVPVRVELHVDGDLVGATEGNTSLISIALSQAVSVAAGTHTISCRFRAADGVAFHLPNIFAIGAKR